MGTKDAMRTLRPRWRLWRPPSKLRRDRKGGMGYKLALRYLVGPVGRFAGRGSREWARAGWRR